MLIKASHCRVGLFPIVTAGHLQGNGLNAKEWVEYCIAGVGLGGKGGGKAVSSGGAGIFICLYVCMPNASMNCI